MTTKEQINEIASQREKTAVGQLLASQPFWVFVSMLCIGLVMSFVSDVFVSQNNLFNVTRNFAFIGIMALGMTCVIITGGIDLSVGSILGLSGVLAGLVLQAGAPLWVGALVSIGAGSLVGLVNGVLVAYVGLSSFVVTLGMLSVARSLALVFSNNQMIYEFGDAQNAYINLGGGVTLGLANPVWILFALTVMLALVFKFSRWGRHLYAIGGNAEAARMTGINVNMVRASAYVMSGAMAGLSAFLLVGWLGAVTNALGMGYELRVIAATVIGGANLMGGAGGAVGALVGASLLEVIRNALLLGGIDAYWQGFFVGLFIIFAVLLERIRGRQR